MDQKSTASRKLPAETTVAQPLLWQLYCWSLWEQNSLCSQEVMTSSPSSTTKFSIRARTITTAAQRMWHDSSVTSLTETEAKQPSAQVCVLSVICKEESVWSIFKSLVQTPTPPQPNKNKQIRMRWFYTTIHTTWIHVELPCSYPQKQSEGKERCSHLILEIETCIWDQPTPLPLGKGLQPLQCPPQSRHPENLAYRFSQAAEDSMTFTVTLPSCEAPFQRLREWHFQTSNKKEMQNTSGSHSHQPCQRKYLI